MQTEQYNRGASSAFHLAEELRENGIDNPEVLKAIAEIPREWFVPEGFRARAYDNEALPIDCGQTISQPYTVARMTQLLNPFQGMKVLEIGTGSGYQAAVLSAIGCRVWSIERVPDLLQTARHRLEKHGFHVATRLGDGTVGWSEYAPYDGIIVTAGAPKIPSPFVSQLSIGGRLVIPVGEKATQQLFVVTRIDEEDYEVEEHGEFRFVPLIGKRGWEE
ncbi:MAG: protein-L-isoaspartate(D-aspartate) O-methyltransferase [Ignavibacteriae bacterium]|nr:protein-L-isoaspartate(D-aspartate) O-methyltransferase [Ignavibacteriota bacterium]MCB9217060.1 protein-L-isoaspartate(D-aspartate) O-methyltransferase [Ignavibacteria bacterium]